MKAEELLGNSAEAIAFGDVKSNSDRWNLDLASPSAERPARPFHTEETSMYQNILVPIDGSEISTRGLQEAIQLAKNQRSQLRLLHIVNETLIDYGGEGAYAANLASILDAGKSIVHTAEALARQYGLEPESVLLESNGVPVASAIIAQAQKWPADLIVMGTHGRRGLRRLAMGSDAESVVRDSPVPVLLVHRSINAIAVAKTHVSDSAPQQVLHA